MVSCIDTVIMPNDKTVEEDFWQTKNEVQMMVTGAYGAFASTALQENFIVWTMRSDELNLNTAINNNNLSQIYSANVLTTNSYSNWSNLYSVINKCNLVISKSESVMSLDPTYLEGDHRNAIGQMKALRALCYFYLVRVFRDVPMVLEPYKLSSQEMNIPQVAPAVIIDQLIADLEEVKEYTLSTQALRDWTRCGYFTRDGVYALLADIYLWKASIFGDIASYDKCIACCDKIRANRSSVYAGGTGMGGGVIIGGGIGGGAGDPNRLDDDGFRLQSYQNFYSDTFGRGNTSQGNGSESLFELQYTGNDALCVAFFKSANNATALPRFFASDVYAKVSNNSDSHVFNLSDFNNDVRGFHSVFSFNGSAEEGMTVRKSVAEESVAIRDKAPEAVTRTGNERAYAYDQNWIIYRATDVMLMKAEALVEKARLLAESNSDLVERIAAATTAEDSLSLVNELVKINGKVAACNVTAARQAQITSTRARYDEKSHIDSTKYAVSTVAFDEGGDLNTYVTTQVGLYNGFQTTAKTLEIEIMNERARELCFEGKRWFDMLRYNYRHVEGVNYNAILADQAGSLVKNYSGMLDLVGRKYTTGGGPAVIAKMQTEAFLYMPISQNEIEVNNLLKQNPVYTDGGTMVKNY